jgi:hypothetical protein
MEKLQSFNLVYLTTLPLTREQPRRRDSVQPALAVDISDHCRALASSLYISWLLISCALIRCAWVSCHQKECPEHGLQGGKNEK